MSSDFYIKLQERTVWIAPQPAPPHPNLIRKLKLTSTPSTASSRTAAQNKATIYAMWLLPWAIRG
jgi:hypothetical protein